MYLASENRSAGANTGPAFFSGGGSDGDGTSPYSLYLDFIELSDSEFRSLTGLIYDRFGIKLSDQKKTLVMGRLNKVLRALGMKSYREYYQYVISDSTCDSLLTLIECISTNHTSFFRGVDHYEYLTREAVPEIVSSGRMKYSGELRVWSAGCATGEEPYSLAMVLREHLGAAAAAEVAILATDISRAALEVARDGIYTRERLTGVPASFRSRYFNAIDGERLQVTGRLKEHILFRRLNLMNDRFPFRGKFNIIFCRNVMIYFDAVTRDALVNRFYDYLQPGGYLFIGHSESLNRKESQFRFIQPAIYRKE